jgi:hypothetical protein
MIFFLSTEPLGVRLGKFRARAGLNRTPALFDRVWPQ